MPQTAYNLSDQNALSASFGKIVKEVYEKPFYEALDRDTLAFKLFPRKNVNEAVIRWKVKYQGNTAVSWYDEDDPYGSPGEQSYENASLQIRMVRVIVQFSRLVERASRGGAWVDVRADEVEGALEDLRAAINDRFLHGSQAAPNPETQAENIGHIVFDANNNVYAGISRTNAWWKSQRLENGGTNRPLTLALMNQLYAALQKPGVAAKPSFILTTFSLRDAYGDIADARRVFTAGASPTNLDVGYGNLNYMGIPIIATNQIGGLTGNKGRMYFIDKRSWSIAMLAGFETDDVWVDADVTKLAIKSYLQLVCKAPFQQGVIDDLISNY
jgi:hypothetical protein